MMDNAEIIMFCGVFIGVIIVFIIYCFITRKSIDAKVDINKTVRNSKINQNSMDHNPDETEVEINRKSVM